MFNLMKKLAIPFLFIFILINFVSAQEVVLKKGKYIDIKNRAPYTGILKEKDAENRLISETIIKDGMLDGNTTIYYPSGAKKEVRAYSKGKKEGTWKTWNEAGGETAEAGFKNGVKDGNWFVWDDNGVKRYEMFYENGTKSGLWIIRDENGKEISHEKFN
jgi:antitoxin component YwqK of YwqJK toxin-antitoxin module